ncbi:zinc-binding dehydrogenase [Latilactobacillus fuchuensis]|uniref:zinc-binding dehydrogenase n=1 Tax=Latilactobacillus fuchuensis TaxID=164393 RepID=UPI0039AF0D34
MQALVVSEPNNHLISQLNWQEIALSAPLNDEIQIQTKAVGLNPVDYKTIESGYSDWLFPHTIGLDIAGIVTAVGQDVAEYHLGDRVAGHANLAKNGVFATAANLPAAAISKIPTALTFERAAASLCAGLTAYQALFRKANLSSASSTVLVQGGAGGVGTMAIQLARYAGKRVFTTVSPEKAEFAAQLQPDALIDYRHEDVDQVIAELTHGNGVDIIINTAGDADRSLPQLAYNGQLICIQNPPTTALAWPQALTYSKIDLGGAHRSGNLAQIRDLGQMTSELLDLVAKNIVDPMISQILTPDQIPAGLTAIQNHQVLGKLVAKF